MTQLEEKRKKEVTKKAQVEHNVTQKIEKQTDGTKRGSEKGARSPLPEIEEEMDEHTKQHDTDPQAMSTHIKHPREQEKGGSRKNSKATETSLDPITLIDGELHDIGDMVRDVSAEAL